MMIEAMHLYKTFVMVFTASTVPWTQYYLMAYLVRVCCSVLACWCVTGCVRADTSADCGCDGWAAV
jgi:hypothetical protein